MDTTTFAAAPGRRAINTSTGAGIASRRGLNRPANAAAAAAIFLITASGVRAAGPASELRGVVVSAGAPVESAQVIAHNATQGDLVGETGPSGEFSITGLPPGHYQVTATRWGYDDARAVEVDIEPGRPAEAKLEMAEQPRQPPAGFLKRLYQAYQSDMKDTGEGPAPPHRGYPAPESSPPFPFADWPYGGSPVIGAPDTNLPPLMQALYNGPHGDWWRRSRIKIYGWLNGGFNISTSNHGEFANAPAAYYTTPNAFQLDQATLYIERVPDTVQTQHFDWGFRITNLYGFDYRFTTAEGYFSHQLLGKNQLNGYDPVMVYFDMYFPHVADGMNIRVGRYISLPDIEAQLAPDNYSYSHSLLYSYDAYTQTGVNATIRLNRRWMFQAGLSAGNDVAPWTKDAKPTFNTCLGYTWGEGGDNLYSCANSINDGRYAYNNLQAYYTTWYHKINSSWHAATEAWYMYERGVPSIFGAVPTETNANGAWCEPGQQVCFAPEWAVVNYVEKQFSRRTYLTIRNEYFDDIRGQRTGYKTRYTEHMIGVGRWIGDDILIRPELRFEHAYDYPAYDTGTKRTQLVLAMDAIIKF